MLCSRSDLLWASKIETPALGKAMPETLGEMVWVIMRFTEIQEALFIINICRENRQYALSTSQS